MSSAVSRSLPIARPGWARTAVALGASAVVVLVLALLHYLVDAVLVLFMGVVLGVLLEGFTDCVLKLTRLSHGISLLIAVVLIVAFFAGATWIATARAADQVERLREVLPEALANLDTQLRRNPFGEMLLSLLPLSPGGGAEPGQATAVATQVGGVLLTTFRVLADTVIVLLIALYLAAEPTVYTAGVVLMAPRARRARALDVLHETARALRWWMIGQMFAMVVVGLLSGIGLWLIGIQLSLALGLITGLLEFIPIAGAWAGAILPILVAFMSGPIAVLNVGLLYLGIHVVEGYILTPLVQRKTIFVPPALLLGAQMVFAVLFGVLGIIVAAPLLAVAIPLVKLLYVEDVLGEHPPNLLDLKSDDELTPNIKPN